MRMSSASCGTCSATLSGAKSPMERKLRSSASSSSRSAPSACGRVFLTRAFTRGDLLAALERDGVPAGPINTIADVFADPQTVARGMKVDLPSAAAAGGSIPSVRSPLVLDGKPQVSRRPSPRLGEHTTEVLGDPAWGAE